MSASQRCCQRGSISRGTYFDIATESISSRIQSLVSPGVTRALHAASAGANKKSLSSIQGRKGFRGTTLVGERRCCAPPTHHCANGQTRGGLCIVHPQCSEASSAAALPGAHRQVYSHWPGSLEDGLLLLVFACIRFSGGRPSAFNQLGPVGLEPATFSSLVRTYSRYIFANNCCEKCTDPPLTVYGRL